MKMFRKCALLALAALLAASAALPVSAAVKSVKFGAGEITKAPVYDGVIGADEYGTGDFISLTDARLDPTAWVAGHKIDPALKAEYKFAWDKTNLYIAVKIAGDGSPKQAGPADKAWFGTDDCIQVFLNPGYAVTGAVSPVCFTIGATKNGMPVVWRSKLGTGVIITEKCKGYSGENKNGSYNMEVQIPWSEILIDTDTVKTSGVKIGEGTEIGICLVYADVGGTVSYVKTDANLWNAADIGKGYIVLNAAPKTETAKTAAAPKTADLTLLTAASVLMSGAGLTILRKRG